MNYQSKNCQPINKHVAALITFIALLPLVYYVPNLVEVLIPESKLFNVIVAVGIIVPIISYGVIPLATLILLELSKRTVKNASR